MPFRNTESGGQTVLPDKTKIDGKLNATFRVIFKHCAILQIFQNSDRLFKAVKLLNVQVKVFFFRTSNL